MAYMFEGFSNLLKGAVTPETIKIIILLITSILLELTIYQCSPDVKLNKWILKYFKKNLPEDKTFAEIIKMYEDEDKEYIEEPVSIPELELDVADHLTSEPEQPPPPIKKPRKPRVKKQPVIKPVEQMQLDVVTKNEAVEEVPMIEPFNEIKHQQLDLKESPAVEIPIPLPPEIVDVIPEKQIQILTTDNSDEKKTIRYRFGRTTPLIVEKLCTFIRACIDMPGEFIKHPDEAALELRLNKRVKEVFLNHLASLKLGSKALIIKKDDQFISNFSANEIIEYATEIIED
jgi:hypothetical protein